jgi:hypothetical protein
VQLFPLVSCTGIGEPVVEVRAHDTSGYPKPDLPRMDWYRTMWGLKGPVPWCHTTTMDASRGCGSIHPW